MTREPLKLKGRRFSYLIALLPTSLREPANGCIKWLCKCDCGNFTIVNSDHLVSGHTKSCGCLGGRKYAKYRSEDIKSKHS